MEVQIFSTACYGARMQMQQFKPFSIRCEQPFVSEDFFGSSEIRLIIARESCVPAETVPVDIEIDARLVVHDETLMEPEAPAMTCDVDIPLRWVNIVYINRIVGLMLRNPNVKSIKLIVLQARERVKPEAGPIDPGAFEQTRDAIEQLLGDATPPKFE